jgi:hypothetical protein
MRLLASRTIFHFTMGGGVTIMFTIKLKMASKRLFFLFRHRDLLISKVCHLHLPCRLRMSYHLGQLTSPHISTSSQRGSHCWKWPTSQMVSYCSWWCIIFYGCSTQSRVDAHLSFCNRPCCYAMQLKMGPYPFNCCIFVDRLSDFLPAILITEHDLLLYNIFIVCWCTASRFH